MTERTVSATEARVHFGELLDSIAQSGDTVIVERGGLPMVVFVPIAQWRRMQDVQRTRWNGATEALERFHARLRAKHGSGGLDGVDIEEEIRASRDERDRQIDDQLR